MKLKPEFKLVTKDYKKTRLKLKPELVVVKILLFDVAMLASLSHTHTNTLVSSNIQKQQPKTLNFVRS